MHTSWTALSDTTKLILLSSRGLGLAVTQLLLDKFGCIVVAISRTRTPEIEQLLATHGGSLSVIECDVSVFMASPCPLLSSGP